MSLHDADAEMLACLQGPLNSSILPWELAPPDEMMFPSPELFMNMSSNCTPPDDVQETNILHTINLYITPVIIVVGITGNLLNFLVFATTHLKTQSSSVYLAFLSMADIGFLIALLLIWLHHFNIPVFNQEGLCQLVVYLTYTCKFLSVWLVASFTVERFIIVCHPFVRARMCTTRRAKLVVLSLTTFAFLAYSFSTLTSGVYKVHKGFACMPKPEYYHLITVCEILDFIFTLLLPCLIISVLNVRIVIKIQQFRRQFVGTHPSCVYTHLAKTSLLPVERVRPSFVQTSFSTEGTVQFTFKSRNTSSVCNEYELSPQNTLVRMRKGTQYRTAKMLLVVSSVFLIFNLPSHVMRLHAFVKQTMGHLVIITYF